jgi:hypothetical protein
MHFTLQTLTRDNAPKLLFIRTQPAVSPRFEQATATLHTPNHAIATLNRLLW